MHNGTNNILYNFNVTLREPSTLVNIKGWGRFHIVKSSLFSAITTQVAKAADQQLEIQVNGNRTVTVAELTEAGYTVEFLFNVTVDADADERTSGKIDASAASFNVAEFKYAVKVTPEEGEAITSDWTTVKVVDAEKATEVIEFGLDNDLDFVAMGDTDVKIKATEALNGLGKKVEADKLPEVDTVKSSNIAVAQYDDGIKTNGVGTVTFTVKFENIEEEYSLTVEVKEARKATSIENEDIKIEAANDFEFENDFAIVVLDQYGKEFTVSGTLDILVKDSEGEVVGPGDGGKYNLLEEDVYTGSNTRGRFYCVI